MTIRYTAVIKDGAWLEVATEYCPAGSLSASLK